jgi:hypothetical protein
VAALQEGGDQRLSEVFQLFDQSSDMEAMAAEECKSVSFRLPVHGCASADYLVGVCGLESC